MELDLLTFSTDSGGKWLMLVLTSKCACGS